MATEVSNLIQVIKKLKQGEKRFITLELSRYKKETDLLKLYNLINNTPGITDAALRKKIKDKKKIAQLSINKHKLYATLLETLQLFHFKSSPKHQVASMIQQAYVVESKNLLTSQTELLSKAEKIAEQYELREFQLEIIHLLQKGRRNDSIKLVHKAEKISSEFLTERKLNQLLNQSILFERQPGNRLKGDDSPALKKMMTEALKIKSNSFTSSYFRLRTCFTYYAIINDHSKTDQFAQALLKLFQSHAYMLELESWRIEYIESLGNCIPCFIHFRKTNQLEFIYKEVERLDAPELYKASIAINVLDSYIQMGSYFESEKKVSEVQKNIDFYKQNIGLHNHAVLYFNLAVLNFGMKKFSKTLFWLNEIINGPNKDKRSAYVAYATRVLRLFVFYELGYTDILENQLRSTTRYITKYGSVSAFDQTLLKCIRKIISINRSEELNAVFKETLTALLKISKNGSESSLLDYFDFISWITSKIEKKSFVEIVQRKSK